ncbi:MAG TPA: thioredoxin domain-containing protein [Fluviicola sp.]|nr:thioredoxin domain-containing protein [Fluviicola sp.]
MKLLNFALLGFLFLSACAQSESKTAETSATTQVKNLSAQLFSNLMQDKVNYQLIDVRTPDEFSLAHIENAQNIDWNGTSFDQEIAKLDKKKPVFVYCLSGARSAAAANKFLTNGFNEIYQLDGGILQWTHAKLPTIEGGQKPSQELTMTQYNQLLLSEKAVLVDFYAPWCAPCKKMEPALREIAEEMGDKVKVIRINIDENPTLTKELKISAIPLLHVYKNQKLTWTKNSLASKEEMIEAVSK